MEANTSHTPAVAGGRIDRRTGLRGRVAALVSPKRRNGKVPNGRAVDEATARIDHYLRDSNAVALHHRHLPASRMEISHLVVGPSGVTVVDSSHYKASRFKLDDTLRGPVRTRGGLVKPVLAQVEAVREILADTPYASVPIEAALARQKVAGARVFQGLNTPRVIVCGARTIAAEASRKGAMTPTRVRAIASYLDSALD